MLFLPLVALGLSTIGAYAKPNLRAAGGLEVSLSTPTDKVTSVSDLKVTVTVKNTGDKNLKIIKSGTVLDNEHYTRSFIVSKDGKDVPFTGAEVPAHTNYLSEKNLVLIPAGSDVTTEHNSVSGLYDFSASGPGNFTFHPVSKFQVIGPNGATRVEVASFRSVSVSVTNVSKRELKLEKRGEILCEDPNHNSAIKWSDMEARFMAMTAVLHIRKTNGGDQLYSDYFGSASPGVVVNNFMRIVDSNRKWIRLICPDIIGRCDDESTAHILNDDIFFCDPFYTELPLGSLCANDTTANDRGVRGVSTFYHLIRLLIPEMYDPGVSYNFYGVHHPVGSCAFHRLNPLPDKEYFIGNYICFAIQLMIDNKCKIVDE